VSKRDDARPSADAMERGPFFVMEKRFLFANWPMMGASGPIGEPGNGVRFSEPAVEGTDLPWGRLYIAVAMRTVVEPKTKPGVILKLKRATEARNEITMLKLVANPLRILSEYLMTTAVTKPPKTWTATVAQAQRPKLRKRSQNQPDESAG